MAVYTRLVEPSVPVAADPMVVSAYLTGAAGAISTTVPMPGKGRLVHVEAITDAAVAGDVMALTITNPNSVTLGTMTVSSSTSAQGDKDTWTDAETGVAADYVIDNDYITITQAAAASLTAGKLVIHCVFESEVGQ